MKIDEPKEEEGEIERQNKKMRRRTTRDEEKRTKIKRIRTNTRTRITSRNEKNFREGKDYLNCI